jgi:hypothetical protein
MTYFRSWRLDLMERERKELALAAAYAQDPHGTDGHGRLLLLAKLAGLLDQKDFDAWQARQAPSREESA